MKQVNITIKKDRDGEYAVFYDVDGYTGISCDEVSQAMSNIGEVQDKKLNQSAFTNEIPIPVPVQGII